MSDARVLVHDPVLAHEIHNILKEELGISVKYSRFLNFIRDLAKANNIVFIVPQAHEVKIPTTTLTLKIRKDVVEELDAYAKLMRVSRSVLVRTAIYFFLDFLREKVGDGSDE